MSQAPRRVVSGEGVSSFPLGVWDGAVSPPHKIFPIFVENTIF